MLQSILFASDILNGVLVDLLQYDISKDLVALNSIRELLVVMRMWGLVRSQCLPVFSRSAENLDVLATLYKLLTRLTLNPSEPDELLLGNLFVCF